MVRVIWVALSVSTLGLFSLPLAAQRSVPTEVLNHRVYALVPMVGTGKPNDPRRPMMVPSAAEQAAAGTNGPKTTDLLSFQMELSDDGKYALVEFVFVDPAAFSRVLARTADNIVNGKIPAGVGADFGALRRVGGDTDVDDRASALKVRGRQAAIETGTGAKFFVRGVANPADVVSEFRKYKTGFNFDASPIQTPAVAQ